MLVHPDAVEAQGFGVFELVQIGVINRVALDRIVERGGDIDPNRMMLFAEIVRQMGPWHQVEPSEFHYVSSVNYGKCFNYGAGRQHLSRLALTYGRRSSLLAF